MCIYTCIYTHTHIQAPCVRERKPVVLAPGADCELLRAWREGGKETGGAVREFRRSEVSVKALRQGSRACGDTRWFGIGSP